MIEKLEQVRRSQYLLVEFRTYFPKAYWGSIGHLLCHALRENNNDIEGALNTIRSEIEDRKKYYLLSQTYELINDASDQTLLTGLKYYSLYEQLSSEEKERLKSGTSYPQLPELIPPKTDEGWIKYYQELLRIQQTRGYKRGWVYHQLKRVDAPNFILDLYQKKKLG